MKRLMYLVGVFIWFSVFITEATAQEFGGIGLWADADRTSCRARDCNEMYQCSGSIFAFCRPSVDEGTGWTPGVNMIDFGLRIDIPTCIGSDIEVIGLDGFAAESQVTSVGWPVEIAVRFRYGGCKEADGYGWILFAKIKYSVGDIGLAPPCSIALVNPQSGYIENPIQTVMGEHRCDPPYEFHPYYVINHVTINQPCEGFVSTLDTTWGAIKSIYK